MNIHDTLPDCPGNHSLAALSRVAAAMAETFEPTEVLERGIEALIEATGAHCGEAYQIGPDGPSLKVLRGCKEFCPFKQRLAALAAEAARRREPVRDGGLAAFPVLHNSEVSSVFALDLGEGHEGIDGCFLAAVGYLTALALDHAELVQEFERREAERVRLLRKWLSAQEEERRRVGQALHDEVGGILTGALLALRLAKHNPDRLEQVREVLGQALDEVRRLSRELRPAALDDLGLARALERHLREFASRTGLRVHAHIEPLELDRTWQVALFRIAQEALTNVARHARAQNVWLTLESGGDLLALEVRDDGRGFSPRNTSDTLGLAGMRERAEQLEGRLIVESEEGKGTRVRVEVPYAGSAD